MNDLTSILAHEPAPPFLSTPSAALVSVKARAPLEELKCRMLWEALDSDDRQISSRRLRLAAERAAAVAVESPFPMLVFPCLFEEMSRATCA